jgi:1-acyl-sn-glycerol-3-phosphate acyltransferase
MSLYGFCHVTFPWLFKIWLRWEIAGTENIPKEGKVVLAANHISLLDPPTIGAACPRPVNFMAKAELFHNPVFAFIIRHLGVFPVRRGSADREAIKTGLGVLKRGGILAIFPEGKRSKTGVLEEAGGGAFMMAVKTKAVLIPAAIWGSDLKRHPGWPKVRILFGKPLEYDAAAGIGRENLEAVGEEWRRRVIELQRQIVPPEERERFEALTAAVEAAHQKRLQRLAERETKKRNPEQR